MHTLGVLSGRLRDALALGPALRERAAESGVPVLAASTFDEPGIVLGALQVSGRVLRDPRAVAAHRRATSGTGLSFTDGGVLFSLALPSVDAVLRDATPATVLNRNLRLFLAGFARAGIAATYLGREWLTHRHRPFAVVGLDADPVGTVLLELFVARRGSFAIPAEIASDLEVACDRYRGKLPAGLDEITELEPSSLAARVLEGVADRAGSRLREVAPPPLGPRLADASQPLSPLPEGSVLAPSLPIPIGQLDLGLDPEGRVFVGGDLLGPVHALGFSSEPPSFAVLGATWEDVASARESARRALAKRRSSTAT